MTYEPYKPYKPYKKQKKEYAKRQNNRSKSADESLAGRRGENHLRLPGGAIMPVYDALFDYTRGEKKCFDHILVRHEQGLPMLLRAMPG